MASVKIIPVTILKRSDAITIGDEIDLFGIVASVVKVESGKDMTSITINRLFGTMECPNDFEWYVNV